MKFEKLDNSKIKIFISSNDMLLNNISADTFFTNNCISQPFLQLLLNNAEKELNFKTDDSKLLVEAIKHPEDGIVFTITKVYTCEDIDINLNVMYKFKDFDDFLNLCTYIKNMEFIDLKDYHKLFSLVLYNNVYYLSVSRVSFLPDKLINILDEFADSILSPTSLEGLVSEYGKVIFNGNAIYNGLNMIKKHTTF